MCFTACKDSIPPITPACKNSKCKKTHKKCRRTCPYWSRKNKCGAKWNNIVSKTCRTRLGGARQKTVRQYCKKSYKNCGKFIFFKCLETYHSHNFKP